MAALTTQVKVVAPAVYFVVCERLVLLAKMMVGGVGGLTGGVYSSKKSGGGGRCRVQGEVQAGCRRLVGVIILTLPPSQK